MTPRTPNPKGLIRSINALLKQEEALLSERLPYGLQTGLDLKLGLFRRKSGLYVPSKSAEPSILFESYEVLLIKAFQLLLTACSKNSSSQIISFTFRTIMEIGLNRANAIFSTHVSADEKTKIKLLSVLSDYAFMNSTWGKDWFIKLYDSEKKIFSAKEQSRIETMIGYPNITRDGIYELRRFCASKISSANDLVMKSVKSGAGVNQDSFKAIYGAYSHMMHGNVFQIETALNPDNKARAKVHSRLFIISAGLNFAQRVAEHLADASLTTRIDTLTKQLVPVWNELWKDLVAARATKAKKSST